MKLIAIIEVVLIHSVWGHFNGPFVFFGHDQLAEMKSSALGEPDTQFLIDLYNKAPAIIVFTRNISTKLTDDNFPAFKDLLSQTEHTYITSHQLNVDPIEYNVNTEVRLAINVLERKTHKKKTKNNCEFLCVCVRVFPIFTGGELDWTIVSTRYRNGSVVS